MYITVNYESNKNILILPILVLPMNNDEVLGQNWVPCHYKSLNGGMEGRVLGA